MGALFASQGGLSADDAQGLANEFGDKLGVDTTNYQSTQQVTDSSAEIQHDSGTGSGATAETITSMGNSV